MTLFHINQVAISGRLDEISYHANEDRLGQARFTVSVERQYRDDEDRLFKETLTIPVIATGKTAEHISQHYHPGKAVFITGRLTRDPRKEIAILVRCIQFLETEQ